MNSNPAPRSPVRRVLVVVAPFAAGAAVAAGAMTGFGLDDGTSPVASRTDAVGAATTNVARASATMDATQIYRRNAPGVVDVTVTTSARAGVQPFVPGGSGQPT